jgi:hypothetical protein
MEGRGKRRQRLRLLRWAAPYLTLKPGQERKEHYRCILEPCQLCEARQNLEAEDWPVVRFYEHVRDQVYNAALAFSDQPIYTLRLEACVAYAQLLGLDPADALHRIDMARTLTEFVYGRHSIRPRELLVFFKEELKPPKELPDAR